MLRRVSRSTSIHPTRISALISKRKETSSTDRSALVDDEIVSQHRNTARWKLKDAIHITDPVVANVVAEELKNDIAQNRCILEANPGQGLLTRRLLELGCQKLHIFETRQSIYWPDLEKLRDEYPNSVKLINENLTRMASIMRYDVLNGTNRMQCCMEDVPHRMWEEEPGVTAVLPLVKANERKTLLALTHGFVHRSMIFSVGRVDILLFITREEYMKLFLSKKPTSRATPLLLDLFFNHTFLGSFKPESFRWSSNAKALSLKSEMCFLRLTPTTEIFKRLGSQRKVEEFSFFLRQVLSRGATLMYLNELIPHATRDVLLKTRWSQNEFLRIDMNTKLCSLSGEELIRVFEILSSHELFPQCPLASCADHDAFTKSNDRS